MGVTSQTSAIREHFAGSSYIPIVPEAENESEAFYTYPYAGDDDALLTKYTDTADIYSFGESTPRLTNLPSGYLSISSFVKSLSSEMESQHHIFASPSYESDFWSPPLSFFSNNNQKRRKISIAQDALSVLGNQREDENHNDVEEPIADKKDAAVNDSKLPHSKLSELMPSFSNVSLPKLPARSWFCNSCRKPKDECNCMCVIC